MNSNISWLLEQKEPSIRYRTLVKILDMPQDAEDVKAAYNKLLSSKKVDRILFKQNELGLWELKPYGTHTYLRYLTTLAELGYRKSPEIDNAVDAAIEFLKEKNNAEGMERYDGCSDALLLRALVMLGYNDIDDINSMIQDYCSKQLADGGFNCKRLLDKKSDRKSCYKASIAGLALYGACYQKGMTLQGKDKLVSYFMRRNVFYKSNTNELVLDNKVGWRSIDNFFPVEPMRVGIPIIISSLSILGTGSYKGMENAWQLWEDKKDEQGRMILEGTLSKQPCSFGAVGKANKWVAFYYELAQKHKHK